MTRSATQCPRSSLGVPNRRRRKSRRGRDIPSIPRRSPPGNFPQTGDGSEETLAVPERHTKLFEVGVRQLGQNIAPTLPPSTRARARAREAIGNQRPWPADKVERWRIDRLIPYAKNARTHTDAQVAAIAASIKEWGWTSPALVGEDGGLIA